MAKLLSAVLEADEWSEEISVVDRSIVSVIADAEVAVFVKLSTEAPAPVEEGEEGEGEGDDEPEMITTTTWEYFAAVSGGPVQQFLAPGDVIRIKATDNSARVHVFGDE